MKKLFLQSVILIVSSLFITSFLHSQSPQGIPYQAVMRNVDGSVMANSAVSLTFMIHDGTANGTVVYQESHSLTSNAQGLVTCVVGNGVVSQGNFSNINWGSGAKFMHVMMGSTDLGTQQMLSVPYALYAGSTNLSVSPTGDTLTVGGQSVIVPGISAANPVNNIPTSGLGSQVLSGNATCANEYINVVGCNGQTSLTYDGRTYELVEIGGQCWFADNLSTDQYRNGDLIPTGLDNTTWQNTTTGAFAIYNNDPVNDSIYGNLYNWYSTVDSRGLCPTGWHVPTDCEWMYLEGALGMTVELIELSGYRESIIGGTLKSVLTWQSPNVGANDQVGFSAFSSGYKWDFGAYEGLGSHTYFWSKTETSNTSAWCRGITYLNSGVFRDNDGKNFAFSIRCLRDAESPPIQGCTDGAACNFLAIANQDDGSCLYQNATCDDGNANTTNDVINGSCECAGTQTSGSGTGAQLLPGNATCATQNISVTGCGGQTSLTYDGRTYDLVEIGGQCWFADNLATDQYRNGDLIPTGLDNATWQNTTTGAYAIYTNDPVNDSIYGKLYNWYTTVDSRGLCPTGWHVPTDCEWMYLEGSLGMTVQQQELSLSLRGTTEGGEMKSATGWTSPNTGATNSSGFTALPGGNRTSIGQYSYIGNHGLWWSSTEGASTNAWSRNLSYNYSSVYRSNGGTKQYGFSVRCVRDSETLPIQGCTDGAACNFLANATQDDGSCLYLNATCDDGNANTTNDVINGSCVCAGTPVGNGTYVPGNGATDIDGNTYTSIIINGQEWMQQNLAVTKYRNGDPIPTGLDDATWSSTTSGAYAIYNNDAANNTLYGKLYNWYAVNDSRGLCPAGWHVPSDAEWTTLETNLGGSGVAGGKMKSTTGWTAPNTGATNESGFTGLPGGYRSLDGPYNTIGYYGYWWSSTEIYSVNAWNRVMGYYSSPAVGRYFDIKRYGYSVRCVRD